MRVLDFGVTNALENHMQFEQKCRKRHGKNFLDFFFFYLGFLSRTFTIHGTAGEGGGYLFNSSLPLPPASQALRHWPGNYCRGLASAHGWQPDSNREPLVSERKLLTTKLRALKISRNTTRHK